MRRILRAIHRRKAWGWLGLLLYACAVTFPHQLVQDLVGGWASRFTLRRVYQTSVALAFLEGAILSILFIRAVRRSSQDSSQNNDCRWLVAFWFISFALMAGTWRLFTANNTELVHYPQYFPEGMALTALTLSPAEALSWIVFFAGLDEGFQYTFLMRGRPAPFDFNDVYMDLAGGAAGLVFAMAILGCGRKHAVRGWIGNLLAKPGVVTLLSIAAAGIGLWASGRMLLYEAPGSPAHWFSLSRLRTPTFWYFSPVILGPHHFHELSPVEGPVLILATIALYALLDRKLEIRLDLRLDP